VCESEESMSHDLLISALRFIYAIYNISMQRKGVNVENLNEGKLSSINIACR